MPIHDRDGITLYQGDCLAVLPTLPSESVALVVADLPYGTTDAVWDNRIDEKVLWAELRRVLTLTGAAIFTATYPLSFELIAAARDLYKYERVWVKTMPFGFVHAANRPLIKHETVLVFSKGVIAHASLSEKRMTYNPQSVAGDSYKKKNYASSASASGLIGKRPSHRDITKENDGSRLPTTVMEYGNPNHDNDHPTQKPLSLITDLILTYSNPNDLVLDPTCGSGTTLRAAANTGRRAIGIEQDAGYCQVTIDRMAQGVLLTGQ